MTYPTIRPEITLDFANSRQLDPRITFSRTSGATYLNPDTGLITLASDHEPRFEKEGLLIEESRTNKIGTSEDTASVMNNQTNCSVTTDALISPDGSLTADTITFTSAGNLSTSSNNIAIAGSIWTWSVFLKAGTVSEVTIDFNGRAGADVNLSLGTIDQTGGSGGAGAEIKELSNGWYRASITYDATSGINRGIRIISGNSGTLHCWGIMVEEGSFPTSYIPTAGQAGGVLRDADIAQITGDNFSSWYQPLENTMFAKFSTFDTGTNSKAALVTFDSTQSVASRATVNGGRAFYYIGDTNYIQVTTRTPQKVRRFFANDPGYNPLGQFNSIAQGYAGTDSGCAVNGSDPGYTASAGLNPGTVDSMWIGRDENVSMWLNGHISRITYYNERLTDAELQTLTL